MALNVVWLNQILKEKDISVVPLFPWGECPSEPHRNGFPFPYTPMGIFKGFPFFLIKG